MHKCPAATIWSCSFTGSVQDLTCIGAFSGREQGCCSVIGTHGLWWRGGQYCFSQQLHLLSAWRASPAVFQSFFLLVYYLVSPSDSVSSIWCGIRCFMDLRVYLGRLGFKVLYTWHWNSGEITVRGEPAFLCTWLLLLILLGQFSLSAASYTAPYRCCVQGCMKVPWSLKCFLGAQSGVVCNNACWQCIVWTTEFNADVCGKKCCKKILTAALTFFLRESTEFFELMHIFSSINFFYSCVINPRKKFTTEILPDMLIFILGKIIAIGQFWRVAP